VRQLFIAVFALLVSDTAACLASRLARCLALTAAAILCAFAKVTCLNCLDMFHFVILQDTFVEKIIPYLQFKVNTNITKISLIICEKCVRIFSYQNKSTIACSRRNKA